MRKKSFMPWKLLIWLSLPLFLWLAFKEVPYGEILATLNNLGWRQIITLVFLNLGITLLFSSRWWIILKAQGFKLPYQFVAAYRLAGFAVSYFTPGTQFGGEPLQVLLLRKRHNIGSATAAASVTLDKIFELIFNFTFLIGGGVVLLNNGLLSSGWDGNKQSWFLAIMVLPLFYLLALAFNLKAFTLLSRRLPLRGVYRRLTAFISQTEDQMSAFIRRNPKTLVTVSLVSILVWTLSIFEFWLSIKFLGVQLDFTQTVIGLTAARIAFLTPLPGGVGALEASQMLAFGLLGFSPTMGISLSLLIRARDICLGLAGLWLGAKWGTQNNSLAAAIEGTN